LNTNELGIYLHNTTLLCQLQAVVAEIISMNWENMKRWDENKTLLYEPIEFNKKQDIILLIQNEMRDLHNEQKGK